MCFVIDDSWKTNPKTANVHRKILENIGIEDDFQFTMQNSFEEILILS